MSIYIYAKTDMDISCFDDIVGILKDITEDINIVVENRRSFRDYDIMTRGLASNDFVVVRNLHDLGSNNADIANRLNWFIEKGNCLVVASVPSTYEYGVSQPLNKAVIDTLLQSVLKDGKNILAIEKKSSAGRSKVEFPEVWDELYEKWENRLISSKEFIEKSGLKKATFYNLVTEYRELKQMNDEYMKRFKNA